MRQAPKTDLEALYKGFSAWVIVPALRPGTRCDPSGVSVRGRRVGGVRQWDPYQGNLIGGVRSHVEKEENLLGFVLAWATVPVVRPGTRCDPCWVSVRGRMAGGVRRWDSYPGNWVGGVGAHAKRISNCYSLQNAVFWLVATSATLLWQRPPGGKTRYVFHIGI